MFLSCHPRVGVGVLRFADGGIGHAAGSGGRHEGVGRAGGVQEQAAGESGPQGGVAYLVLKYCFVSVV